MELQVLRQGCVSAGAVGTKVMLKDHRDDGCHWVGAAILLNLTGPSQMVCPCPEVFLGRFLS